MYHYVRPIKESPYPEIKGLEVDGFLRQLEFFKKSFHFVTAEEVLDCIYDEQPLPQNSVWLTFDDGFKDHFQHVFPILQKFEIQGAFFPPAKPIEENVVLDVHKIHFILASVANKQKIVDEIFSLIKKNQKQYDLEEPEKYFEKLAIANRFDSKEVIFIKRILQRDLPKQVKKIFTDDLFKKFVTQDEEFFSKNLYLSFDVINEMKENGMFFSSHSYSHEWLSYLSNEDLFDEIHKSIKFLKKIHQNSNYMIMCYPYGNCNNSVIQELKNNGFKAGLTTEVGDAIMNKSDSFLLKRYDTNDFPQ